MVLAKAEKANEFPRAARLQEYSTERIPMGLYLGSCRERGAVVRQV